MILVHYSPRRKLPPANCITEVKPLISPIIYTQICTPSQHLHLHSGRTHVDAKVRKIRHSVDKSKMFDSGKRMSIFGKVKQYYAESVKSYI